MNIVQKGLSDSLFMDYLERSAMSTAPWDYSLLRNVPQYTAHETEGEMKALQPSSEMQWKIPRLGLLKSIRIKTTFNYTYELAKDAAASSALWGVYAQQPNLGAHIAQSYTIRARMKDVAVLYPMELIDYAFRGGQDDYTEMLKGPYAYAWSQGTVAGYPTGARLLDLSGGRPADLTSYQHTFTTPLPFSYTERLSNALKTDFCEDLVLVLQAYDLAQYALYGSGDGTTALESKFTTVNVTFTPIFEWVVPSDAESNRLQQQIVAAGPMGMPRLQYSTYRESIYDVADGATSAKVQLFVAHPVVRTLIFFSYSAFTEPIAASTALGKGPRIAITSATNSIGRIEFFVNGVQHMSTSTFDLALKYSQAPHQRDPSCPVICIEWSLVSSMLEQGGFMPMRNFSSKALNFIFGPLTAGTAHTGGPASIEIHHIYQVIEQTAPGNGQINVSAFD